MPPKSQHDVVVYRGNYPGWPWAARTASGSLICVFRDDSVHGFSPTGKVLLTQSRDLGETWTQAQVVVDEEGIDNRNAAVAELPDKTWLVCYNSYTCDLVCQCWVTLSRDQGASWARPRVVADLDARTRGTAIALANGDVLLPIYKAPGSGSVAARSSDGGKIWTLSDVPDTDGFLGDEWVVQQIGDGRVIGLFRNNLVRDGFFWKSESRDDGRTWDVPVRTNVQSARNPSPPHLDFHGATPVLTYADRRMVSVSMVITGDPDFVRWDVGHRLPCYQYRPDGEPIDDSSYPVSVAVGVNRRFVVDYEIRAEGKWITGYFVNVPQGWR